MASIVAKPPNRRPSIGAPINYGHPLASSLKLAVIADSKLPVDSVSGQVATVIATSVPALTPYADEGVALSGTTAWKFANPTGLDAIAGVGTIFIIATIINGGSGLFLFNSGENIAGNGVGIRMDDALSVTNGVILYGDNASQAVSGFDILGTSAEIRMHRVAITWDGTNAVFYVRGAVTTSVSTSWVPTANANRRTRIFTQWAESVVASPPLVALFAWNRVLTRSEILQLSITPYAMFAPQKPQLLFFLNAAANAYTLTAAQGSYTLSGQAAAFSRPRTLVAAQGSFTLSGQSVALGRTVQSGRANITDMTSIT